MNNIYGGDEVSAVVLDVGSYSTKVGFAGEDAPKSEIPSIVANKLAADLDRVESGATLNQRYYIGTTQINAPSPGKELQTFLRDGMIEEWDLFEKMMDYIYAKQLSSQSALHPVLFSEVSWNSNKCREKLIEIMFEKYGIPSFYLAKNAVLVAFCAGRSTGIIFDSGAEHTAVIPVLEGCVLNKKIIRNQFAGEFITKLCYHHLIEKKIEVNPYYLVKSKEKVEKGQPSKFVKKNLPDGLTTKWKNYMLLSEIRNYKSSVLKIYDTKYVRSDAQMYYEPVNYEFPDGYNFDVSLDDQFLIPEVFFNKSFDITKFQSESSPYSYLKPSNDWCKYPDLLKSGIFQCDEDIIPLLLNCIILSGGNTLIEGFTERMYNEIVSVLPKNFRVKFIQNNTPLERKYASWIGGSIMASLGTFQQLWISKLEYDESGKSVLRQSKCFS